jgi:hypothetical protein
MLAHFRVHSDIGTMNLGCFVFWSLFLRMLFGYSLIREVRDDAFNDYGHVLRLTLITFMGAITNNSRKPISFVGFYKGIPSAGAAIIWQLDGYKLPYMNLFISCWVLLAGGLIIALPVTTLKIKDTVPVEKNLKFTDETIEDVIGYKNVYEPAELKHT